MADHGERAHAEYAPSAAYRWMRCHGSIAASRGIPAGPSSIYAEEGTECHEAASEILEGMSFDKATRHLSDEQKLIIEDYTDFCFAVQDEMMDVGACDILIEQRMHAPGISPKFFGTGDWLGVARNATGLFRVIDLKAGAVPVYVRDKAGRVNPQLASYVLLGLAQLGAPVSPWHFDPGAIGIKKIKLTIVQPRVYDRPQTTQIDFDELEEFLGDLCAAIDAIEAGDTTRFAGEWCKFCPAKGACPTLKGEAVKRAAMDFEPETNLPFEHWAAVLAEAELIAAHVNGIREKIRRALEQGRTVPGFKLVAKRQTRQWRDWDGVDAAMALAGVPEAGRYSRKPVTPAGAERALKLARATLDLSPWVELSSGGPTIAPEDDPRPAVIVKPGADFEEE